MRDYVQKDKQKTLIKVFRCQIILNIEVRYKVDKINQSYVGVVNKMVWRKK